IGLAAHERTGTIDHPGDAFHQVGRGDRLDAKLVYARVPGGDDLRAVRVAGQQDDGRVGGGAVGIVSQPAGEGDPLFSAQHVVEDHDVTGRDLHAPLGGVYRLGVIEL